jgi:hypothetical protein
MPNGGRGNARVILAVTLVLLVGAAATAYFLTRPAAAPPQANATTTPATAPAETQPTTASSTKPSKPSPPTTQYLDVVRAHHPRMPVTQPMGVPLDLSQAARVVLSEPIYLSPRSDLWITRPDAPPTPEVLARAAKEQGDQLTLAIRERVVFAHWTPQENGPWTFTLVVRGPDGRDELVTQSRRTPIDTGRTYHWHRALDWGEKIVVATNTGVSVIHVEPEFREQHVDLIDPKLKPDVTFAEPQFLMDWEGILAWVPWEGKKAGSVGAARFVDDKWSPLGPDQGWPDKLLHLVPLYDGGVLQLVPYEEEWVKLAFTSLEKVAIDEAMVAQLVEKLSDTEDQARQEAFKELTRYGASAWPILEKLMPDQGPEAQARLRHLLKSRAEPTLGGMSLLGDKLRMVARLSDGGAVVYAEVGVATAGDSEEPVIRSPAWISIRPGQAVSLLDPVFTTDMNPDRSRIYALGEEWVVVNNAAGPQRFVGNGFVPLLRKSELSFSEPIGMDRRGRWFFRKPTPAIGTAPASAPATAAVASETLVVDPTIPDPTPRLPVWLYTTAETVGWDQEDWPAVKRGGSWTLREDGWRPMKRTEKMFSTAAEVPAPVAPAPPVPAASAPAASAPAASAPAARGSNAPVATPDVATASAAEAAAGPATAPSTAPAEDLGPPILIDKEGSSYFDGRTRLVVVPRKGQRVDWPLPPTATGVAAKVFLVRTPDGLLFLYNQAGRMLRIRPTPDEAEPFLLEATFTRNIPNTDDVTRLWVDPAGRIIMAYGNKLAIMFPRGFMPPAIASKMPPRQADAEE